MCKLGAQHRDMSQTALPGVVVDAESLACGSLLLGEKGQLLGVEVTMFAAVVHALTMT